MPALFKTKHVIALLSAISLAGCALAPGMSFNEPVGTAQDAAKVTPIIKEITPQLLRAEADERDQAVPDQDLKNLITTTPQPYRIGSGDVVQITLLGESGFGGLNFGISIPAAGSENNGTKAPATDGYTVGMNGDVYLPYVGYVKLAGLSEPEAQAFLVKTLSRFIKKPEVGFHVISYRSKHIYVDGEVKAPGVRPIVDTPMTLTYALGEVGGILPSADQSAVQITRAGKSYVVNLPRLLAKGINPSSILLQDGDFVVVPSREKSSVVVLGEVSKPGILPLHNDGRLTLNEALGGSGGLDPRTADARQVYVVRNAGDASPVVYHLDASSPVALAWAESFELKAKDIVYVDAAQLERWNRVVTLILPSAQTVYFANKFGIK